MSVTTTFIADRFSVVRFGKLCFALLFAVVLFGALDARAQETNRGEVVIFRGIIGYWPRIERFQEKLGEYRLGSQTATNIELGGVSKKLRRSIADGAAGPRAIVGYSLGARSAIQLARDLEKDKVHVPIMVLIDPPIVSDIPSNVGRCVNLYKTHPLTDLVPEQVPIMRGVPVRKWSPRTQVINRKMPMKDVIFGPLYDNHLTIASTDVVQDQIAATIAKTLYQAGYYKNSGRKYR